MKLKLVIEKEEETMEVFKTKEDQLGVAKMIARQTMSDGDVGIREVAIARIFYRNHKIPVEVLYQAYQEVVSGNKELPEMSKEAIVSGMMALLAISMCDNDFTPAEVKNIQAIGAELGIEHNEEVTEALIAYVKKNLEINGGTEELICSLGNADNATLENVFPTPEDKKCYIKCMMKVANLDSDFSNSEDYYIRQISASYRITPDLVEEAIKEYNEGKFEFTISSELGKTAIIRNALRVAGMDNDFSKEEQEGIKALSKELGIEVSDEVIKKFAELISERTVIDELKKKAEDLWLSL